MVPDRERAGAGSPLRSPLLYHWRPGVEADSESPVLRSSSDRAEVAPARETRETGFGRRAVALDFSDLIRRAREGDGEALSLLYEEHVSRVLAAIRSRLSAPLRRKYDTLDLGHSVYLEVLRDLPGFEDRGETAFRSWLSIKAESKVREKFRKDLFPAGGRREVTLLPGDTLRPSPEEASPLSCASRNEKERGVRRALDALDARHREVLRLRNEDVLTFAEVAGWMDLPSAEAARKLYARALLRLRRKMKTG
jgi:RNA polymerase sigma factor (sigma-70 family)